MMGPATTIDGEEGTAMGDERDELHGRVEQRLQAVDQRYSSGRRRLVEALAAADCPVTIPELLEERTDIPMSSAYRNLTVLEQVGAVTRIATFGEHARFELAEDLTGHHHHLICTNCGRIEDFVVPDEVEHAVDESLADAVRPTGFQPTSHRMDLLGICARCQG
ncbi:MAG: Fur family transcriptional regulator [Acidimicrobiales bacterium]